MGGGGGGGGVIDASCIWKESRTIGIWGCLCLNLFVLHTQFLWAWIFNQCNDLSAWQNYYSTLLSCFSSSVLC